MIPISNTQSSLIDGTNVHFARNRYKLLICGTNDVGKSCFIKRLVSKVFDETKTEDKLLKSVMRNIGNDFAKVEMEEVDLEQFIHRNPEMPQRDWIDVKALLFLYSTVEKNSFDQLKKEMPVIQRIAPPDCIFVLIGTKADLNEKQVTWEEATLYSEQLQVSLFEISSKNGINCEHVLFETLDAIIERQLEQEEHDETVDNQPVYQDTVLTALRDNQPVENNHSSLFCWLPKIPFLRG